MTVGRVHDVDSLRAFVGGRLATAGRVAAGLAAVGVRRPVAGRRARRRGRRPDGVARAAGRVPAPGPAAAAGRGPRLAGAGGRRRRRTTRWRSGWWPAAAGLAPVDAARWAAYDAVMTPATAAVRLLGLDPFAVSALVAGLAAAIDEVAAEAAAFAAGDRRRSTTCRARRRRSSTSAPRSTPCGRCVSLPHDHVHDPHARRRRTAGPCASASAGRSAAARRPWWRPCAGPSATSCALAVVTNDIYTEEDAEFLRRAGVLDDDRITAVQTGCCPHTAIRDDISANLEAVEDLEARHRPLDLVLVESGGDNLTATFSRGLVDRQVFVIDVAGGDKVPRKGGPGVTVGRPAGGQQDRPGRRWSAPTWA